MGTSSSSQALWEYCELRLEIKNIRGGAFGWLETGYVEDIGTGYIVALANGPSGKWVEYKSDYVKFGEEERWVRLEEVTDSGAAN
jgi:hypothetical protein